MSVTIRPGEPADVEAALDLWRAANTVVSSTDDPEALLELLERDPAALLLAGSDDQLVGTLIVGWDGWRANFYRLAVAPAWRRKGIGRGLVEAGEARLRALGARRAATVVITAHDHADEFWRALGYEPDPRLGRYAKLL